MLHSNLKQQAEEFLKMTDLKASEILAFISTKRQDTIETEFGSIKVIVNPYLPPDTFYLVSKEDYETQDWLKPHATTNSV